MDVTKQQLNCILAPMVTEFWVDKQLIHWPAFNMKQRNNFELLDMKIDHGNQSEHRRC